ncbi:hypothetical protein E2I00_019960, partial [Balaenoptera physalus]
VSKYQLKGSRSSTEESRKGSSQGKNPPPSPEQARKSLGQRTVARKDHSKASAFAALSPLGMAAPSMKERQACWGARDEYWKCLDENTEDASQCKKLRSSFESSCPQQWIKYFDKRRDYLKFKEKFEAGEFQPPKTATKS